VSNTTITYLVAGASALGGVAAFVYFVLVPAWASYSRAWERVAASLLSLYVLAALVVVGTGLGLLIVYLWDEVT